MLGAPKILPMLSTGRAPAARAFYGETLGFPLLGEDEFAMIFTVGSDRLRVAKAPMVLPSAYAVMGFVVEDIAAETAALAAKGVTFERYPFLQQDGAGIWTAPGGAKVAWFRDPDGNLLSLTQD